MKASTVLACALMLVGVGLVVHGAGSGGPGTGKPFEDMAEELEALRGEVASLRSALVAEEAARTDGDQDLQHQVDGLDLEVLMKEELNILGRGFYEFQLEAEPGYVLVGGGFGFGLAPTLLIRDNCPSSDGSSWDVAASYGLEVKPGADVPLARRAINLRLKKVGPAGD